MAKIRSSAPSITKVKKVKIFDEINDKISENLLDLNVPKNMYNLHLDYGKLSTGIGVKNAEIQTTDGLLSVPLFPEEKIEQIFVYYRYDRVNNKPDNYLIARAKSGYFYRLSLQSKSAIWEKLPTIIHRHNVMAINYRFNNKDVILFCSDLLVLTMYDGETVSLIGDAPRITSITEHYGRIFVSTYGEGDVWFSDDYNPENWNVSLSEAGFIKFSDSLGKTVKVVSFNDYIYVFREYGIYRLVAIGDQKNFELTKVLELNSKIYKNSICICNDRIMFLTSDGLYSFNGFDTKKVKDISKLENISENNLLSSFIKNKYIVCYTDKDNTPLNQNNSVFVYLLDYDKIELYKNISILDITPIKFNNTSSCLVVLSDSNFQNVGMLDYSGKCYNNKLKYSFKSVKSYLGDITKYKYIHKIRILSSYDLTFKLTTDLGSRLYLVKGSSNYSELIINTKTKMLSYEILGLDNINLSGLEIEYSEVK